MATSKVAIVTGAAGGIGLAMAKQFIQQDYRVVIADINVEGGKKAAAEFGSNSYFVHCDVSSWESQAAMFKDAFEWAGRLDVFVANAGIEEQEPFYKKPDVSLEPKIPNLKVMEVDLLGVLYGLYLFRYYWHKSCNTGQGKMIVTASMAGIYAFHAAPVYSAAKHGIVGIVRSSTFRLGRNESITLNCICPGPVDTGVSEFMKKVVPEEQFTPMALVLEALDKFVNEDLTGQVAECSNKKVYLRNAVDFADENSKILIDSMKGFHH